MKLTARSADFLAVRGVVVFGMLLTGNVRHTDQFVNERTDLVSAQAINTSSGSDQVGHETKHWVTDQVSVLTKLSETQWSIVLLCEAPRGVTELMDELRVTHRTSFRRKISAHYWMVV